MRAVVLVLASVGSVAAQEAAPQSGTATGQEEAQRGGSTRRAIQRWIDWQVGSIDTRYRFIETSEGVTTSNQQQHKETLRVRVKLDSDGRYAITGGAASGSSLTSGWDNLGIGRGDPTWDLSLRQLFVSARPVDWIDGEIGGLYMTRGESTEITSYDNDAFVTGARVRIRRPDRLYFDEITATAGRVDTASPTNVFRRFREIDDHNFTQVIASRRFGDLVRLSLEWNAQDGISYLRQAVRVEVGEWLPLDAVRVEQYQRVEGEEAWGLGIDAERGITDALTLAGGFATIDEHYPPLNGDRYLRGRRFFGQAEYALREDLELTVFYTQALEDDFVIPNQHRFEVVLSYDVRAAMRNAGLW